MLLKIVIDKAGIYSALSPDLLQAITLVTDHDTFIEAHIELSMYYFFKKIGLKFKDTQIVSDEAEVKSYVSYDKDAVSQDELATKFPGYQVIEDGVVFISASPAEIDALFLDDRFAVTGAQVTAHLMEAEEEMGNTEVVDLSYNWAKRQIFNRFAPYANSVLVKTPINPVNVNVYVMDSGINAHSEITAPVENLYTVVDGDFSDKRFHGTALASLIAGDNLGVTHKDITLKNVKIFDTTGDIQMEALVNAFIAIRDDVKKVRAADPTTVNIVNMSWSIPKNPIIETIIVSMMFNYHIMFVASAGNNGETVDAYTPASMPEVLTVAASDEHLMPCAFTNYNQPLTKGTDSNYGTNVDLFAPGANITVADGKVPGEYMVVSGTSFAAAITTGALALIAQCQLLSNQFEANEFLTTTATKNMLDLMDEKYRDTPNNLLYVDLVTRKSQIDIVQECLLYDPVFFGKEFERNEDLVVTMYTATPGCVAELEYDKTKLTMYTDGNLVQIKKDSVKTDEPYQIITLIEKFAGPNTMVTSRRHLLFLYDFKAVETVVTIDRSKNGADVGISPESAERFFAALSPDTQTAPFIKFTFDIESVLDRHPELENTVVGVALQKACGQQSVCRTRYSSATCNGTPGTNCYWDNYYSQSCASTGGACFSGQPCSYGSGCYARTDDYVTRSGDLSVCCFAPGTKTYNNGTDFCNCV